MKVNCAVNCRSLTIKSGTLHTLLHRLVLHDQLDQLRLVRLRQPESSRIWVMRARMTRQRMTRQC